LGWYRKEKFKEELFPTIEIQCWSI